MTTPLPELLTTEEVAELLRVKTTTVNTWAKDGTIRGVKINNGRWRFYRKDVLSFLGDES